MKAIAQRLLDALKARHPGEFNELKHALHMFIHDNDSTYPAGRQP